MPFRYTTASQMAAATWSTHATPGTEIDFLSIKPGVRNAGIYSLRGQGRGAALAGITGIEINVKRFTTASTGGTGLTPSPADGGDAPACKAVVLGGTSGGTAAVTSGTGGPTYRGGMGMGGGGPGGWVATDADDVLTLDGSYAGSLDLFSISGVTLMLFSWWMGHVE
jgi:hypothetical protein